MAMHLRVKTLLIVVMGLLPPHEILHAADRAFVWPQIDYSAERTVLRGQRWQNMRVFYSPGKERMDLRGALAGGNSIILRRDLGKSWIVIPLLQAYAELPANIGADIDGLLDNLKLTPDGQENIDGLNTARYRTGGGMQGYMWLTRNDIPVRIEGQARIDGVERLTKIEQRDIQIGPQDTALFEPPSGLQRIELNDPRWSGLLRRIISGE